MPILLFQFVTKIPKIYFFSGVLDSPVLQPPFLRRHFHVWFACSVSGIMRTEDLKILFKNTTFRAEDIKTYIIDLLNKFEVALLWDNENLLIPSLLPTEMDMRREQPGCDVRVGESCQCGNGGVVG